MLRRPSPAELSAPRFHKARKHYALFSGLLIAWELIGIELPEAPFATVKVSLKSPHAAPVVLLALVVYFGFRLTLEWRQCAPARREVAAPRVDFLAAHALAAAAVVLYTIQQLLDVQVAEQPRYLLLAPTAFLASALNGAALRRLWFESAEGWDWRIPGERRRRLILTAMSITMLATLASLSFWRGGGNWYTLSAAFAGSLSGGLFLHAVLRHRRLSWLLSERWLETFSGTALFLLLVFLLAAHDPRSVDPAVRELGPPVWP